MSRRDFFAMLLVVLWAVTAAAAAETVSRVFTLKHLSVAEATDAVQPLLSEEGSLTLQPSRSRLTVQDFPDVIDRVALVIDDLDKLPSRFRVHVELLQGGDEQPFGAVNEIEANDRLRKMFKFPSYRILGSAVLVGNLGGDAQASLGHGYQVSFLAQLPLHSPDTPWGAPDPGDRIQLRGLVLERLSLRVNGEQQSQQFLRTNVLLSPNQKVYIGAGNSEDPDTGLVLIIQVQEPGGS